MSAAAVTAIAVTGANTTCAGCNAELGRPRRRGLGAYCDECKGKRTVGLASSRKRAAAVAPLRRGEPGTYERRALGLVRIAADVDQARADVVSAQDRERRALTAYRRALRALIAVEGAE